MLSGPRQKFCEGIVSGLNGTDAYLAAYPKSSKAAAGRSASDLLKIPEIVSEIERLKSASATQPGYCVLTLAQKRDFLYRLVTAKVCELDANSDLWNSVKTAKEGTEYKLPDKLKAIETDNDLAGEGSEAKGNEGLAALIARIRK